MRMVSALVWPLAGLSPLPLGLRTQVRGAGTDYQAPSGLAFGSDKPFRPLSDPAMGCSAILLAASALLLLGKLPIRCTPVLPICEHLRQQVQTMPGRVNH